MLNLFRRLNKKNAECAQLQREKAALLDDVADAMARIDRQHAVNAELLRMLEEEGKRVSILTEEVTRLRVEREIDQVLRGIEEGAA
jgi:hypothetical protein